MKEIQSESTNNLFASLLYSKRQPPTSQLPLDLGFRHHVPVRLILPVIAQLKLQFTLSPSGLDTPKGFERTFRL